ncbi:MAG: tetratricopeptide repeat protein [Pyrinomonadaceae bacterium]
MKAALCLLIITMSAALAFGQRMLGEHKLTPAEIEYNRGLELQGQNDLDGAIAAYTRALALDSKLPDAYNNRGDARKNKGDLAGAVADFSEVIRQRPDEFEGYFNRGIAYLMLEKWAPALSDLTRSVEFRPQDPGTYFNRGSAYHGLGQEKEAIADFTKTVELYPAGDAFRYPVSMAVYNRGIVHQATGNTALAIADYTRVIELTPNFARGYSNRAVLLLQSWKDQEGMRDFATAFKLDPSLHAEFDEFIRTTLVNHKATKKR